MEMFLVALYIRMEKCTTLVAGQTSMHYICGKQGIYSCLFALIWIIQDPKLKHRGKYNIFFAV